MFLISDPKPAAIAITTIPDSDGAINVDSGYRLNLTEKVHSGIEVSNLAIWDLLSVGIGMNRCGRTYSFAISVPGHTHCFASVPLRMIQKGE